MATARKRSAASGQAAPALTIQLAGAVSIAPLTNARLRQLVRAALATGPQPLEITLRFTARREARALNAAYRQGDYDPNVLTFDYPGTDTADIVICPPVVREQAREQHKRFADHLSHMVVHGVLHALGHTHDQARAAARMEKLEIEILARFGIADPYQ